MFVLAYAKFKVLDQTVELFRDETAYGFETIGVVDDFHLKLGDVPANLDSAMVCWEKQYRPLSSDERDQVLMDNGLKSLAV
jgi:hypothetical protein